MSMTLTIEIPALDRLCAWLEDRDKAGLVGEIENEIVRKLEEAVKSGVPKPAFKEVPADDDHPWKDEAKPAQEKPAAVALADVQQACARLRDAGKMNDVKALFPEFGIKKLSDLKGADQLAAFAARLKKLEG